jgi:hypothetical protein
VTVAYIRSDEDYYASLGYSPERIKVEIAINKANIDYGVCNPRKAKLAAEQEEEIRRKIARGED